VANIKSPTQLSSSSNPFQPQPQMPSTDTPLSPSYVVLEAIPHFFFENRHGKTFKPARSADDSNLAIIESIPHFFFTNRMAKNKAKAFEWNLASAERGNLEAIKALVSSYTNGYGTEPSAELASFWNAKLSLKTNNVGLEE
jgi:hypothetical protein